MENMPGWISLIEHSGALCILGWVLYYIMAKREPTVARAHEKERDAQRELLITLTEKFTLSIKETNVACETRAKMQQEAIDRLALAIERIK